MSDRHNKLKHERIAQHASVQWEKSQISEALVHSSHVETSTYGAHISLHPFPSSSSSYRRRFSPTDASLPPSSRRRQVSPIHAPEVSESPLVPETPVPPLTYDASELVPPPTTNAVELVPPPDGEVADATKPKTPQAFVECLIELSLLPLYPDHTTRHIWDGKVTLVVFILFNLHLLLY